jgi:hypothetical protein
MNASYLTNSDLSASNSFSSSSYSLFSGSTNSFGNGSPTHQLQQSMNGQSNLSRNPRNGQQTVPIAVEIDAGVADYNARKALANRGMYNHDNLVQRFNLFSICQFVL